MEEEEKGRIGGIVGKGGRGRARGGKRKRRKHICWHRTTSSRWQHVVNTQKEFAFGQRGFAKEF